MCVLSTGMTTQARSSYLVNEILWGHRFEKLITFQKEDGTYKIDYSRFDVTVPIDTPTCSAKEWAELREQEKYYSQFSSGSGLIGTATTATTPNMHNINQHNEFMNSMSNPSIFTVASTSFLGGAGDLRKRNSFNNTNRGEPAEFDAGGSSLIKMIIEDHSAVVDDIGVEAKESDQVNNSNSNTTTTTSNDDKNAAESDQLLNKIESNV